MATLRSVIARLAWTTRCAGLVYVAVQVVVCHRFYATDPWRLWAPVAAMAWAVTMAVRLRRRWPSPRFACADSAAYVTLALSAQGAVPAGIRDHAFSWVVISMSSQLIVPAWYGPAALSVPLALCSPAAYWIGATRAAGADHRTVTSAAILLILVAGAHLYGRRELGGRAEAADAILDRADRAASEHYVILSRNIERREHERLLHDTVLNTLTALARAGGDVAEGVSRCRQDVALIEAALSDPDDPGPRFRDVADGVRGVAAEMRARGLDVHVDIAGEGAADIPATVTAAISNAAREALSNVIAHAGTGQAWVEVRLAGQDRLRVTVRDDGAGFDPARVDQTRLGLRRSIAERTADCGGQAAIWSAPGQGTVVTLSWPAAAEAGQTALAGSPPAREGPPW